MFSLSIAENVTVGNKTSRDRLMDALRISGIKERVEGLALQENTPISRIFDENGVELSGGETQKLAIARAIFKDSPLFILDEPTAALDPIAEQKIFTTLNKMVQGRTCLYISHRMAACLFCDRIIVFSDGRIKEEGSHLRLLEEGGLYSRLWESQAKYYQ